MFIGGYTYAGGAAGPARGDAAAGDGEVSTEDDRYLGANRPAYFRTISTISHASLASAYQAMRAQDLTMVPVDTPLPGEPDQEVSVAEGFISSGGGIPSAMSAYAEFIDDDGEG